MSVGWFTGGYCSFRNLGVRKNGFLEFGCGLKDIKSGYTYADFICAYIFNSSLKHPSQKDYTSLV